MADSPERLATAAAQHNSHLPAGSVPTGARQQSNSVVLHSEGEDDERPETSKRSHGGIEGANADLQKALAGGAGKRAREEDGEQEGVASAEGENDVYMGLFLKGGRLGIAVYDECEETLSVCEIADGSALGQDMEGLRMVLFQVRPTLVVTNAKPEKALEDVLLDPGEGIEYNVAFAPSKNFQYISCKNLLLQLDLRIFESGDTDADKRRRISSEIDLEAKEGVSAAGGLVMHLQTSKIVDDLSDSPVIPISRVKGLRLDKFLSIDPQTLSSLQIFHQDAHPSFSGCGSAKEGLSLFSLLDNTKSPLGRRLLRMWFVRPLLDEADINGRLKAVSFFTQPTCHDLVGSLRNLLRGVKDVPRILLRIRKTTSSVGDWASLADSLEALFQLREVCRQFAYDVGLDENDERVPAVFARAHDDLNAKLHNLEVMLRSMIDFPESAQAKRVSIQPGICDVLDERKRQYEGLGDFLHSVAEEESADLPPDANVELFVLFCPQLGYMVASPNDESKRSLETAPGFKLNFATNEWIYWKTPRMEELDETVGDIFAAICDREFQLANMIRTKILEWHDKVLEACNVAAELDCVLSFAVAAVERDFCEPSLVNEPVLYVEGGRHPLCELCTQTFVPNDISLDAGSPGSSGLSIITGANFSGKSVCMKQAALIAFMAHIGSWVPAKSCQVGLIDRIFSRVQSRESCATASSSFAIDLSQVPCTDTLWY
uniref:DNA mismatch repair protein MutS core domain-containing protein n=1 Tax=Hemiselmis andersenii TaxID=464988 RepID=A0A7S1E5Q3_HEMAN